MNPMKRAFVDVDIYASRNMSKDKNIDYQFWFDKTIKEKLAASVTMIELSFNTKDFVKNKVDRKIFSSYKKFIINLWNWTILDWVFILWQKTLTH